MIFTVNIKIRNRNWKKKIYKMINVEIIINLHFSFFFFSKGYKLCNSYKTFYSSETSICILLLEDDWSSNREYRVRQRKLTLSPGHFLVVRCLTSFSRAARGQQTSQRVPKCHGNKHQLRPSNLRQVSGLNGVTADQSCFDIPRCVRLSSLVETRLAIHVPTPPTVLIHLV